ncbi:MAG: hypothetical protein HY716_06340 [Planctomycetes bacterium]|nr:hypothetical protein [Planctomycetota bacterium]
MRKSIIRFWWVLNALLLPAFVAASLHVVATSEDAGLFAGVGPPDVLPAFPIKRIHEAEGTELLRDLPNPLRMSKQSGKKPAERSRLAEIAVLHGIDQMAGDSNSATAYIYLPLRKLQVNAYLGEDIRDSATGEGISELAGWKLAGLIPGGAVFRNGTSEETLRIGASPWSGSGGIISEHGLASTQVGHAPQITRQWAISAKASSEHTPAAWSAQQACGAPNTDKPGSQQTAWATKQQNTGEEWIELTYSLAVIPVGVRIHEVCAPGAVVRVEAINAGGAWQVLWQGTDPTKGQQMAWFEVPFDSRPFSTRSIRITLNTASVQGWNEIDAVELVGKIRDERGHSEEHTKEPARSRGISRGRHKGDE